MALAGASHALNCPGWEIVGISGPTWTFEMRWDCYPRRNRNFLTLPILINHYRAIELSSAQMLACAAASDWSGLRHCAQFCSELIQHLGDAKTPCDWTASQKQEKNEIMKRVLAIDAQIRHLAEPAAERHVPQCPQTATRLH